LIRWYAPCVPPLFLKAESAVNVFAEVPACVLQFEFFLQIASSPVSLFFFLRSIHTRMFVHERPAVYSALRWGLRSSVDPNPDSDRRPSLALNSRFAIKPQTSLGLNEGPGGQARDRSRGRMLIRPPCQPNARADRWAYRAWNRKDAASDTGSAPFYLCRIKWLNWIKLVAKLPPLQDNGVPMGNILPSSQTVMLEHEKAFRSNDGKNAKNIG